MIKTLEDFIREYTKIVEKGPIKSHREGDTGVGKTLEDLLGIEENNDQLPDFGEYELKSHRKNASSMLTLVTKSPDGRAANARLLDEYGYIGDSGRKELHISLRCGTWVETKDKAHRLSIGVDDTSLFILADDNIKTCCSWNFESVKKALEKKYALCKMVHALADSEKRNDGEYFSYTEAFMADGISGEKLINAIKDGIIVVDIRMGTYPDGRPHDHGTGFRIMPKDQFNFYEHIKDLVGKYCEEMNKKHK
jgi:hypothetical protein